MADKEPTGDEAQEEAPKQGGILPWIIVGALASAIGAVVPLGMSMMAVPEEKPKAIPYDATPEADEMMFLPFGDVTVNLDEGRMNRYLRVKIVLYIRKSDEALVQKAINDKNLILRNWLLSNISDKVLDDIRGKAGQNMLRREIRDYFNVTLFDDSYERVYNILFEEFNVQ